jgi:hypothetical protein
MDKERRIAELEFVSSAYSPDEAWTEPESDTIESSRVHRRLDLAYDQQKVPIRLTLTLPGGYPTEASLDVSATIEDSGTCSAVLLKSAYNALPKLVAACRQVAAESMGEEFVFTVLSHADEWILDQWPDHCKNIANGETTQEAAAAKNSSPSKPAILGRRLIYSHHIISKIKRADMKDLASHYKLTGYIKIGWPGIVIIEGTEEDCQSFYDEIRPWQWQYLVVRGEQQETVPNGKSVDDLRRFQGFHEEDNMAFVAQQCREVGLESLFRTSMKVYDNEEEPCGEDDESLVSWYGALVYVDHMNNGKAYRKWLRKTSQETDCFLMIKQCYPNQDFSRRPRILVGIVGDRVSVASFLKRWRTSRVDEDSKGKPCLERMMSVVIEGELEHNAASALDWDDSMAEEQLNVLDQQLMEMVTSIGGDVWSQSLQSAIRS